METKRRPLIVRGLSILEPRTQTYWYDPALQLNVDRDGRPVVETADVSTHTMTKREGDPPEAPDMVAAAATHTFTRQQGDRPESPDVWDVPGLHVGSGDGTADDASTGVVTF